MYDLRRPFASLRPGTALLGLVLLAGVAAAQGPSSGSPFVDAPLDIEALQAPPDRALEVLLLAFGVFLLVPLAAAGFLVLARLRNLEDTLVRELGRLRAQIEAANLREDDESEEGAATGGGLDVESATARLEAALASVRTSIERAVDAPGARGKDAGEETARIVAALDAAREGQAAAARETIERLEALATAVRESARVDTAAVAAPVPAALAAPGPPTLASVLDRVHTRLAALGYTAVEIVTPRDEITPDVIRSGALVVEARRAGAVHKGRVVLEDGAPSDVQLTPGHGMFP